MFLKSFPLEIAHPIITSLCPEIYFVGHAAERDNTGFVYKSSAIENCETSAVGRALAFAGFGGDFAIASKEEVDVLNKRISIQKKN